MDRESFLRHCDVIYRKSMAHRDLEPVPGDFLLKKTSMEIFTELSGARMGGRVLEIGCGSGFNSALLSGLCGHLVATDLPYYDSHTHSLGITIAKDLLSNLGVKNTSVVSCTGEVLPFADGSFDLVFSSSVVEHIDDKEAALKEMMRVVKPGGSVIFIIPTFMQSTYAFIHSYLYILKRAAEVFAIKVLRMKPSKKKVLLPTKSDTARSSNTIARSFFKSHPSFPLPEPHGSYKNIFQEFHRQLPWNWIKFTRRAGASSVDTFALLFLPFNILEVFSTRFIARAYYATRHLHRVFAKSPLQYFCYAWCIIAKKQ